MKEQGLLLRLMRKLGKKDHVYTVCNSGNGCEIPNLCLHLLFGFLVLLCCTNELGRR
jgi:hypothetical protein